MQRTNVTSNSYLNLTSNQLTETDVAWTGESRKADCKRKHLHGIISMLGYTWSNKSQKRSSQLEINHWLTYSEKKHCGMNYLVIYFAVVSDGEWWCIFVKFCLGLKIKALCIFIKFSCFKLKTKALSCVNSWNFLVSGWRLKHFNLIIFCWLILWSIFVTAFTLSKVRHKMKERCKWMIESNWYSNGTRATKCLWENSTINNSPMMDYRMNVSLKWRLHPQLFS